MKKTFLLFCYYANILMLALFAMIILAALLGLGLLLDIVFFNETAIMIRTLLSVPVFILWVYCLVIWGKQDKDIGRFFLLFFLIGFYSPFYFRKSLKKQWV
jgi:hypothetical protein